MSDRTVSGDCICSPTWLSTATAHIPMNKGKPKSHEKKAKRQMKSTRSQLKNAHAALNMFTASDDGVGDSRRQVFAAMGHPNNYGGHPGAFPTPSYPNDVNRWSRPAYATMGNNNRRQLNPNVDDFAGDRGPSRAFAAANSNGSNF